MIGPLHSRGREKSRGLDLILQRAFPIDSMDPFADDLLKALDQARPDGAQGQEDGWRPLG